MPGIRKRILGALTSGALSNELGGVADQIQSETLDIVREMRMQRVPRQRQRFAILREIVKAGAQREPLVQIPSEESSDQEEIGDESMHSKKYWAAERSRKRKPSQRAKVL